MAILDKPIFRDGAGVDATLVTGGNWQSSILAPNATLAISNGSISGSVFASEFVGGGQIRNYL
jgi:choice-of-anchor A domain-containing protein